MTDAPTPTDIERDLLRDPAPRCVNCTHHELVKLWGHRCNRHPARKPSIVTGDQERRSTDCYQERSAPAFRLLPFIGRSADRCGPEGKFFTAAAPLRDQKPAAATPARKTK